MPSKGITTQLRRNLGYVVHEQPVRGKKGRGSVKPAHQPVHHLVLVDNSRYPGAALREIRKTHR